ncbi:sigma-54 interaction domain-containing protein [Ihubacter massiliensis]|uniref:sigma-54 interaction domain-containing protein n=1 Tax=Ihubacter massiliensis TaxID=1852367 RepID=UPI0025B75CAA|nr:sigma 54-interacting transcriptional regulator [Ihubacter massiliensis]
MTILLKELEAFVFKKEKNTWSLLAECPLIGLAICDKNGEFVYVNQAHADIVGRPAEYHMGIDVKTFLEEGAVDKLGTLIVLDTKQPYLCSPNRSDGKQYLVNSIPIFGSSQEVEYVVSLFLDVSLERKLRVELDADTNHLSIQDHINSIYRRTLTSRGNDTEFIFENKKMKEIKTLINYIKDSNSTVLITGESGTGKEEVAKLIFRESNRNTKPYIALNCAAIPENLLESELFGYEKGAFTNSDPKGKSGIFESVNGGTLFLDEIAELPMDLQAKLLRVLQESEVRRIGGMQNISVDVRIIAATNKNLEKMVQDHTFREDLYYRLNIIPIHIPPLRERKEDIPLLAYHFIQEFNQKYNKNKNITTEAYNELLRLPFNGNVRQLKTLIERIILLCADDNILSRDVRYCYSMTEDQGPVIDTPLDHSWKNQKEREVNELILHYKSEGLSTYQIAEKLGISQPTVWRRWKKLSKGI